MSGCQRFRAGLVCFRSDIGPSDHHLKGGRLFGGTGREKNGTGQKKAEQRDRFACAFDFHREESFLMYWGLFLFSQNVIYNNSAQNQGDQKARRSLCICGCEYEAKKAEPRTHFTFWVQPGAADRDRTGTVLPPRDFKSLASANSATAAYAEGCSKVSL